MTLERDIARIVKRVEDTQSYSKITDSLFETKVSYGRICVWFTYSDIVYSQLSQIEKLKMNTVFYQKCWNVFKRGTIWNKCVILYFVCKNFCEMYLCPIRKQNYCNI